MPANLLALDFGTSAIHCMVSDAQGNCLAFQESPIHYFTPANQSELAREFHPTTTLETASRLTAQTLAQSGITSSSIATIGITSQRHGLVFLDDDGQELMVSPNVDLRAAFEGAALQEELGATLYESTGQYPPMLLAPAKVRWFETHRPDLRNRLAHILTIADWLAFKLTGTHASETSLASGVGLLNALSTTRDSQLLSKLDLPPTLLPDLYKAGEAAGYLNPDVASEWGLPPHIPVTLAGADSYCGLVGMGLTQPGDTALVAGWSATLQTITDKPRPDPQAKAWFSPSPIPGRWLSESNLGDAGKAHLWLKDLILGSTVTFGQADKLAASAAIGSNGSLAFLGPAPLSAPEAGLRRGGLLFPTPLQYRTPNPSEVLRAFWESLAFSVKANLSDLERVSGHHIPVIHLGGGMAGSGLFAGILASVLERRVRRSLASHVSLLGAVASASVAAGLHPTLIEASHAVAPPFIDVYPDPSDSLEYQEFYEQWKILYHRLQND